MKKTISLLRQLQADSMVLFMKIHNYHWHVRGGDFFQVHAETEKIYDAFADRFDDLAELIVQLGEKPVVTLAEALKTSKIKEESKTSFRSKDIFVAVLKDYEYLLETFIELSKASESEGIQISADYANEQIAHLQKSVWMLKAAQG